ncbi:hypothetical protein FQN60_006235 [Etheostoma spectabile]|uniref:Uncharacterized protein n=1 Tax=Etheostoma spectabile TaxID=54343 RepID=A0A5J5CLQ2_9PERO|nr:hypothetical protein FQN60_006235 [Etheostoma spectabile]
MLLPQDVACKTEEVGFLWRKRSQNRQGWVQTPCSKHFVSTGHPAAERAARFCGTKLAHSCREAFVSVLDGSWMLLETG